MAKFDSKSFNPQAFGRYVDRIPNLKRNELIKSRALRGNSQIKDAFSSQTGTAYAVLPMYGLIGGEPVNYDGKTDITTNRSDTYERGAVVVGRANSWTEGDFSEDIAGGVDFMDNVAQQIAAYWDDIDQATLLSILKGIFSMTGTENLNFINAHTVDIAGGTGDAANVSPTTLNSAIQQASGDNKSKFSLVICHSTISTNLENLNLLAYLKYTDAQGIQRDLSIGTWNGKTVIIDDGMPIENVPASGSGDSAVAAYDKYTTYVLGDGAFDYENIGAKVPYEMNRDPKTNGGEDTLYSRQRKCFAPYGISYIKKAQASLSPTSAELENGTNWELVNNGETGNAKKYINHKAIPIARIISRG